MEWAIDVDGALWLLQSRHVTTEIRGVPEGPIYGPGPVAETFPEPLTELECDLWARRCARPSRRRCCWRARPRRPTSTKTEVVVVVHGHVAIDLKLAGEIQPKSASPRS